MLQIGDLKHLVPFFENVTTPSQCTMPAEHNISVMTQPLESNETVPKKTPKRVQFKKLLKHVKAQEHSIQDLKTENAVFHEARARAETDLLVELHQLIAAWAPFKEQVEKAQEKLATPENFQGLQDLAKPAVSTEQNTRESRHALQGTQNTAKERRQAPGRLEKKIDAILSFTKEKAESTNGNAEGLKKELLQTRQELKKCQTELTLCKDDLFRLQPEDQVPDSVIMAVS